MLSSAIKSLLSGISSRVFPEVLPQGVASGGAPFIIFDLNQGTPETTKTSSRGIDFRAIVVTVYSQKKSDIESVSDEIFSVFDAVVNQEVEGVNIGRILYDGDKDGFVSIVSDNQLGHYYRENNYKLRIIT